MIEDNDLIVIVRLITGEELIAAITEDEDTFIELKFPMQVKSVPSIEDGNMKYETTIFPWCSFTDDRYFRLNKSHVMFHKKLHNSFIQQYIDLVDYYCKEKEVRQNKNGYIEEIETEEDLDAAVGMLESMIDGTREIGEDNYYFFVEGSVTKH